MSTATISQKGWVVIPAALRKKYALRPGARVLFVDYNGALAVVPAFKEPVRQAAGLVKGGASLSRALKEERRRERARDRARERRRVP